ncbi:MULTISPECIES: ABC transporter substrate-binding protein [Streptomyces]|uniref:ABC transporter substrate-binding protein n=1 Tax=Streptomyces TaxID=1883 RepID=UPI00287F9A01|nr:extracellular solute-binding protein [Streptomyces sp. CGMCC 4.1456]WNF67324.1 extracellular solute-binding protein [Streptomyces sp. CGMCC 4.1456]
MSHVPAPPSRRSFLAAAAGSSLLVACGSSLTPGAKSTDAAGASAVSTAVPTGKITLVVADADDTTMTPGLLAAFREKYPNVTFKRQYTGWDDYLKSINTTMSADSAPDIAQFVSGMNNLVKGRLLLDVGGYGKAYGWSRRFPGLDQITFSADGRTAGTGALYGVPGGLSFEGVYCNKAKVRKLGLTVPPATLAELEALFAKAKAAGETALVAGNLDGGLNHPFNVLLSVHLKPEDREAWAFGRKGAKITGPEAVTAATTLKRWVDQGYVTPKVNGTSDNDATAAFARGEGVFRISGNWAAAAVGKGLGEDAGQFNMPPITKGGPLRTTGAGVYYCVSSKSKNAAAAAAFLDFCATRQASAVTAKAGFMAPDAGAMPQPSGLLGDVRTGWQAIVKDSGLQPFIQNASTPTMPDTLTTQLQLLAGGKVGVEKFLAALQADFDQFHS